MEVTPSTRVTQSTGPYRRVDGTMIGNNFNDLIDYTLDAPLNLDEHGSAPPITSLSGNCEPDVAWSGTAPDGTANATAATRCNDWTTSASDATWGRYSQTTSHWTQYCTGGGGFSCTLLAPLYCFEQ